MIWRAIDLETWPIVAGTPAPKPVSAAWADVQTPEVTTLRLASDPRLLDELRLVLSGGVIGHNIAYDMGVLAQWFPQLRGDIWQAYADGRVLDTLLECLLADIAKDDVQEGYSLAACSERLLGVAVQGKSGPDSWRLRYNELETTPIEQWPKAAEEYARLDVTYTARLFNHVKRRPTDDFEARAAWALSLSSCWGLRTDADAVDLLERTIDQTLARHEQELRQWGILRSDGSKNTKAIEELVLEDLGVDCDRTPSGKVKCDKETLDQCSHPALVALAETAGADKIKSAFLKTVRKGTLEPIHPYYFPILTSDRVSCRNPNIQQMPRKGGVRECFRPRKGNVYVSVDYAGAELVCLAEVLLKLFGQSAMADALLAGMDLHLNTAAMLLGRTYEQTVADYKAGDEAATGARQLSKALNFGLPAGLSPQTLQGYVKNYGIDIDIVQATDYRNRWFRLYPEMDKYLKMIKTAARAGTFKITHPLTGFVRGGLTYTSGANHYFQSLLAKCAKQALWDVSVECYGALGTRTPLAGARIAAFIHDEVLLEVRADRAAEAAERLAEVMRQSAQVWMPTLPLKADPTMMTVWSKKAKTLRDESGRLLAWSP